MLSLSFDAMHAVKLESLCDVCEKKGDELGGGGVEYRWYGWAKKGREKKPKEGYKVRASLSQALVCLLVCLFPFCEMVPVFPFLGWMDVQASSFFHSPNCPVAIASL